MAAASGEKKTEKPTPERLKKARDQGQFLAAKGMVTAVQFLAVILVLRYVVPHWAENMRRSMLTLLARSLQGEIGMGEWPLLVRRSFADTLLPLLEAGGVLFAITMGTHLAITKMGFSFERLTPKFSNFNVIAKLKEIPRRGIPSMIEAMVLLTALGLTVKAFFTTYPSGFLRLSFEPVRLGAAQIFHSVEGLLWKAAAVFLLFGGIDFFRQYRRHMETLGMTKREIKDENKRNQGDPQIRARIRRLRRELLRKQMMRDVPSATAVIMNPTHFAIAIRYEMPEMACPVVVAKGRNWLALRIRQIAREHEVPVIENPPLARALYQGCEVGQAIPPDFYKAVAEVLAYIYRVMGRKLP
jgi:flagellar biosynthetic protein FlhB